MNGVAKRTETGWETWDGTNLETYEEGVFQEAYRALDRLEALFKMFGADPLSLNDIGFDRFSDIGEALMRDARAQLEKVENLMSQDLGEMGVERAAQGQGTLSGKRLGVVLKTSERSGNPTTSSESWRYTSPKGPQNSGESEEDMMERGI